MKPAHRDMLIGLTTLVGVAGLVVILLLFGELARFTERTYRVEYRLNTAEGLVRGSKVKLNGVPIGQVVAMEPIVYPARGVSLVVEFREGVRVPETAEIGIAVGLLGEGALSLTSPVLAVGQPEPEYLDPGDVVVANASTIFDQISRVLSRELGDFREAATSVRRLGDTYTAVGERVQEMLASRSPEDVDAGAAEPNISTVIARLDGAVAGAESWLGDAEMRGDARSIVASLRTVVEDAKATLASVRDAAASVDDQTNRLGERAEGAILEVRRAAESLTMTLAEARSALEKANAGEGTVGQLLNNADLYRSLVAASERLSRALEEAQLLIEKWKSEGLPIRL